MAFKLTLEFGGYVRVDGEIQVVGVGDDGAKHGEVGRCLKKHAHTKQCVVDLLDVNPVVTPAGVDTEGESTPEVLGLSIRQRMAAWFAQYDATPDDAAHVEMPKKTIRVKNDKGNVVDQEVEDRDLKA